VLRFEDLARDPLKVLNETLAYLGLPAVATAKLEARHSRKYPPIDPRTAERLREHFAPHNARLQTLIGQRVDW
jgi:hypothetical protein